MDNRKVTVLFSGRKMGKSSLLRHRFQQCRESTDRRPVWVGCMESLPGDLGGFWRTLLAEFGNCWLREGLESGVSMELEETVLISKGTMREAAFHETLDRVKAGCQEFLATAIERLRSKSYGRLFVLLDEADSFARAEWIENSGRDIRGRSSVSWFLRDRETEYREALRRVVFAGYDELGRKENLCHSAFGNWGNLLELGPLDESAAQRLIIDPLAALALSPTETWPIGFGITRVGTPA